MGGISSVSFLRFIFASRMCAAHKRNMLAGRSRAASVCILSYISFVLLKCRQIYVSPEAFLK